MIKHLNLVNALLVLPLAYWLLHSGDYNYSLRRSVEFARAGGGYAAFGDVMFGVFIVTPLAAVITTSLFWWFKEKRTLANVATVFSCAFGVLSCLYFLWTIRP